MNIGTIAEALINNLRYGCAHGHSRAIDCGQCGIAIAAEAMKDLAAKVAETLTVQDVKTAALANHGAERIKAAVEIWKSGPADPKLVVAVINYLTRVFEAAANESAGKE